VTARAGLDTVAVDLQRFLDLIWRPGEVREIRVPKYNRYGHTASGYFDSPASLAQVAAKWDDRANLYVTLNPVNPALLSRAASRIAEKAESTTSDADIVRRRWLFIDIDPVRPAGISSTEAERQAAREVLDQVVSFLSGMGWPEGITAMSGNGWYLLYPIDLPNDALSLELVRGVLNGLAARFNTETVHIDTTVCNAARIAGLIGSRKVKGDSLPERPHRRSRLESIPEQLIPVPERRLAQVAVKKPQPETPSQNIAPVAHAGSPSLEEVLRAHGIEYRAQPADSSGITWYHVRKCPFHEDECRPFECGVGQKLPDGPFAGKCFHADAEAKGWREWKEALGITTEARLRQRSGPTCDLNSFPLTDAGNAELFAHLYGHQIRYDHARGRWLLWEHHRWAPDSDGEVYRLAKEAARTRYLAATEISDLDLRKKTAEFAVRSEFRQKLEACLALAQNEHPIADAGENWDAEPYLLGVANGVVDLRTGELRPGKPEDRITMRIPVDYDPRAECPRWEHFLHQVFQCDTELIGFVQRATGYSLTGSVREQVLFLCHGSGANGKSVLLSTLRHLAGDYAMNIPFTVLELQQRPSMTNDLAAMSGKRLVTSSETNESTRLNEARIKAFTGGDPITARFLYSESFTFQPVAKFWLAVNHLPQVRDDSHGFWRRVRVLPFRQRFSGQDADPDLVQKLYAELPGILAWAVQGMLNWQVVGLAPPDAVMVATEAYREENDELSAFVTERCVVDNTVRVEPGKLFSEYQQWAEAQGIPLRQRLGLRTFGTRMKDRFAVALSNGKKYYLGVGLKENSGDSGELSTTFHKPLS
jgi:putative DNA primase/helicase